jgi:hypothetical protein
MGMAPESLKPALVWEFNRRFLSDTADRRRNRLSILELIAAFVNYPLDVTPRPLEGAGSNPNVTVDPRIGAYNLRGPEGIVTHVVLRTALPPSEVALPPAGSFWVRAYGQLWVVDVPTRRKGRLGSDAANVVHMDGRGNGTSKLLYAETFPDGSALLGADMSNAFNEGTDLKIAAERHIAVDYSGACGKPLLVAVVDRVRGGGQKDWQFHTSLDDRGRDANVADTNFFVRLQPRDRRAEPTMLSGILISPAGVEPKWDPNYCRRKNPRVNRMHAVCERANADYFAVFTLGKGMPPKMQVAGTGLDAVVRVGKLELRFDGKRLVWKR